MRYSICGHELQVALDIPVNTGKGIISMINSIPEIWNGMNMRVDFACVGEIQVDARFIVVDCINRFKCCLGEGQAFQIDIIWINLLLAAKHTWTLPIPFLACLMILATDLERWRADEATASATNTRARVPILMRRFIVSFAFL